MTGVDERDEGLTEREVWLEKTPDIARLYDGFPLRERPDAFPPPGAPGRAWTRLKAWLYRLALAVASIF